LGDNKTENKICKKCKNSFPATLEYFTINKRSKDGFYIWCKTCKNNRMLLYRNKIKQKKKCEHLKHNTEENTQDINNIVTFKICTKCKNSFPATLEYFTRAKMNKDGLNSYCKECWNNYIKSYNNNRNKKEENTIITQELITCKKCGISKPKTQYYKSHVSRKLCNMCHNILRNSNIKDLNIDPEISSYILYNMKNNNYNNNNNNNSYYYNVNIIIDDFILKITPFLKDDISILTNEDKNILVNKIKKIKKIFNILNKKSEVM
jgi:hypothetical protein